MALPFKHDKIQTTERYLGTRQNLVEAVNDSRPVEPDLGSRSAGRRRKEPGPNGEALFGYKDRPPSGGHKAGRKDPFAKWCWSRPEMGSVKERELYVG